MNNNVPINKVIIIGGSDVSLLSRIHFDKIEPKNIVKPHIKPVTTLKELFSRRSYMEFNADYESFVYSKTKRW